jgi:NADH-quinone oxidoreductase subunit C
MTQEEICAQLRGQFGEAVSPLSETKGDRFAVVKAEKIVEVCRLLKNTTGLEFDYCQDITAVDWPARKVIEVVFHLYSLQHRHGLVLKVETDRDQPVIPTVEGVWKAANWLEREIYDLYGVQFTGHSDLRRILMPDDWVGHPLRKDYHEAGGYRGIGNERPDPLVHWSKVTDEKRKAVAAAFAASAPPTTAPVAAATAPATTAASASTSTTTTTKGGGEG